MVKALLRSIVPAALIGWIGNAIRARAQRRELYHALVASSITATGLRRPQGAQAVRRIVGPV